ncbi:MAG: GTPase ObgE [Chloroflexi bacterium]|nr:GTPase ObgE [Chloroflexota bacterium]MYD15707.1 GTPase ObgE [Chloroflexota bacterium]MYJ02139.1 GTPase ObgE [Chloroflexota bacterium]
MIDAVEIDVEGGSGGRGAVSFRREKFVPRGGPDGGRGGRGGDVVVIANSQLNTLRRYRRQRRFRAESGANGGTNQRRGRGGSSLLLELPVGTIVSSIAAGQTEQLADLESDGQSLVVAWGGRGGHGNMYFRSATNQTPRVAQKGEPGERRRLKLELQVIADVGIVGLPNAGKSSLLRYLSAAQPRVADYPFTTLEPHLGVVSVGWDEFVMADLPGLIEGAAEGAGLGHDFLRHTERTRVLVHLIDGSLDEPRAAKRMVDRELAGYSPELAARPQIVVVNKADLEEVDVLREEIAEAFNDLDRPPLFCSAATGEGTDAVVQACAAALSAWREEQPAREPSTPVVRPRQDGRRFEVEETSSGVFAVSGSSVERFVAMMELDNDEALAETYRWLDRRGVAAALQRAGCAPGNTVRIGRSVIRWEWER